MPRQRQLRIVCVFSFYCFFLVYFFLSVISGLFPLSFSSLRIFFVAGDVAPLSILQSRLVLQVHAGRKKRVVSFLYLTALDTGDQIFGFGVGRGQDRPGRVSPRAARLESRLRAGLPSQEPALQSPSGPGRAEPCRTGPERNCGTRSLKAGPSDICRKGAWATIWPRNGQ